MNQNRDVKLAFASVRKQHPMRFVLVTLALGMLLSLVASAQDVPNQKVDQIFSVYDKPGSPGCSLGVIRIDPKIWGSRITRLRLLRKTPFETRWQSPLFRA